MAVMSTVQVEFFTYRYICVFKNSAYVNYIGL
jgi:hypothetical protein